MATATQNSDSSKGSNGKSNGSNSKSVVKVEADKPDAKAEEKKDEGEVKADKKPEKKINAKAEGRPFDTGDVERILASQMRLRTSKAGADPFEAKMAALGFVRRLIRDNHGNSPDLPCLVGVLKMAARAAFIDKGLDGAAAAKAAVEALEDALLPPKFTVDKIVQLMGKAKSRFHEGKWIQDRLEADRRYTAEEREMLLKVILVEACSPKRTPEELQSDIDRSATPCEEAAEILGMIRVNLRYSDDERQAMLKAAINQVTAVLVSVGLRADHVEAELTEALRSGGGQRHSSRPPQHRSGPRHNSRPRGNMPQSRVAQEAAPNDGRRGGRLPKDKRPIKADRKPQASKPKPEGNGKGSRKQQKRAAVAASAN